MHFLLLLCLFPYGIEGLSCIANGRYLGKIADHGTSRFDDALRKLAEKTVNNTPIGRCHVTISLDLMQQGLLIHYHGNNITDELPVTMHLHTEFQFVIGQFSVFHTLTYVCSSDDYCDLNYAQNYSQWLFILDVSQLANQLGNVIKTLDNGDYKSSTCVDIDEEKQCPSHVCRAVCMEQEITAHCVEKNQIPDSIAQLASFGPFGLAIAKPVIIVVETTVTNLHLYHVDNSGRDKHQLSYTISCFCSFNLCNDQYIFTLLIDRIKMDFNVTQMLDFLSVIEDQETVIPTTPVMESTTPMMDSTTSGTHQFDQISIAILIFVQTLYFLFIDRQF